MSYNTVLTDDAQFDLEDIYNYGLRVWGIDKAKSYYIKIFDKIYQLQEHPFIGVSYNKLLKGLRYIVVGSHYIYYEVKDEEVRILRILSCSTNENTVNFKL